MSTCRELVLFLAAIAPAFITGVVGGIVRSRYKRKKVGMKTWKVTVTITDRASNDRGETFRHLSKKQIEDSVIEALDNGLPQNVRADRVYTEEK